MKKNNDLNKFDERKEESLKTKERENLISKILPSAIDGKNLLALSLDLEYACSFSFIEYDRRRNDLLKDGKYISLYKYLWPMLIIQCDPENYIIIDNLYFFSLEFKSYELEKLERLKQLNKKFFDDIEEINEFLTFVDDFLKNVYIINKKIEGLIEPEILKGISPLIKLDYDDTSQPLLKLKSAENQDKHLDISQEYIESLMLIENKLSQIKKIIENLKINKNKISELFLKNQNKLPEKVRKLNNIRDKNMKLLEKSNILYENLYSEKEYLKRWSIPGSSYSLILPISRIWFPLYIAKIKRKSGEINWIVAPPLIMQSGSVYGIPIDVFHPSFLTQLKERVENNFNYIQKYIPDFTEKQKNLFREKTVNKFIIDGFNKLSKISGFDIKLLNQVKNTWKEYSSF
ncbi:MAG: hypothetical protein GF329_01865 [Candidatus Lokiarchaeota archaeon]|nr:hypothetical protein [Candidatus Lokiarchaeota archaeon]